MSGPIVVATQSVQLMTNDSRPRGAAPMAQNLPEIDWNWRVWLKFMSCRGLAAGRKSVLSRCERALRTSYWPA